MLAKNKFRKKTFCFNAIAALLLAGGLSLVTPAISHDRPTELRTNTATKVTMLSSSVRDYNMSSNTNEAGNAYGPAQQLSIETPAFMDKAEIEKINAADKCQWTRVRMKVTAYCPCAKCCGSHSDGYTANMHKIKWGDRFVAADSKFPFGTEIIIPGYNNSQPVKVMDRGSEIRGDRLDVFYNTHHTAKNWGVQYLDVLVKLP